MKQDLYAYFMLSRMRKTQKYSKTVYKK